MGRNISRPLASGNGWQALHRSELELAAGPHGGPLPIHVGVCGSGGGIFVILVAVVFVLYMRGYLERPIEELQEVPREARGQSIKDY